MNRRQFLQATTLAASALPFVDTATGLFPEPQGSSIVDHLKRFAAEKRAQAIAAARAEARELLPEFNDLFAAAEKGDWPALKNVWEEMIKDNSPFGICGPTDWRLQGIQSKVVQEIYGAFENIMERDDEYVIAYGRDIIGSIPVGSIYFSGTDTGRFVVTALCNSQVNGDPFFTVTQNALADSGYMHYLRSMYGTRIHIPTEEESTNAFSQYLNDACRRLKENKLRPGEEIEEIDGKLNVSGQIAVMAINGLLAKIIFDKNPDRECYIEESFPLGWMYPHLAPHGLVMKINRQALAELSHELVRGDREYWTRYIRAMIGDWMHHGAPLADVLEFIEKVHVNHDLGGFKGDPRFVQNDAAQEAFSKLRTSIAGIYAWRARASGSPVEKERMLAEADFAFRQAIALCPRSLGALFSYTSLLAWQGRTEAAVALVETALKLQPRNVALLNLFQQLVVG